MKIVGYGDRFSVATGEKIRFMVSSQEDTYKADIVRLIHGDTNPHGPGFKEELIETIPSKTYPGKEQKLYTGSFIEVSDKPQLRFSDSFSFQAWIYPTTPRKGLQGLVTKWSSSEESGYGVFVDPNGSLAACIEGVSGKKTWVSSDKILRPATWYFVSVVYDSQECVVKLYQEPLNIWPRDESRVITSKSVDMSKISENRLSLIIAGHWEKEESGKSIIGGHYNGKIDSPCLFNRALSEDEVVLLRKGIPPTRLGHGIVGAWNFAQDFSSAVVTDKSGNGHNGIAVNMPARAMTGHNWTGNETNFNNAPSEYGAIHFHDDDLEDAKWDLGFELVIPNNMKSGVYAARLKAGDGEDHVPFWVRPKKGIPTAPILLIMSSATYLAYANNHKNVADKQKESDKWEKRYGYPLPKYTVSVEDKYMVSNNLTSLYSRHSDGSGVCYSSRLRPIVNMRPKYNRMAHGLYKENGAPYEFGSDLYLVDWLSTKGYEFDVVDDENVHHEGLDLLSSYRVVITGSHPEYWSEQGLDALESYMNGGGRVMYMGGNGFYWVTSYDEERPHVIEVRRRRGSQLWEANPGEYYHSTTGERGSLWKFRGRSPHKLMGVGYTAEGYDNGRPYYRAPGSFDPRAAFIFEGINDDEIIGDFGLMLGGAAGYEFDRADMAFGTPPHALILAVASNFSEHYTHCIEEVNIMDPMQTGTTNPLVRAEMVYFETTNGGAVFSASSISYCGSLSHNNYDNNISRITENVLNRFTSEEPIL